MTWPTVINLTTAIPGDGFDGWQNYWNLWWIKEALLNRHTHFFFTDLLYPPTGVSLLFHTLNFFNGLWTLPLQLNSGLTVAYNAVVFFHFTMAGWGVYLLARYVLAQMGRRDSRAGWAAFGAGFIFTFSPFHMAHLLGHMQVLSLTWPPFYVLWLFRTLNGWRQKLAVNPAASLNPVDLVLCGLFLALTTMVDWYQTLYLLLFTALALGWTLWRVYRDNHAGPKMLLKPVGGLAAMGLLFGLLFAPLLGPMVAEAASADYMRPSFEENVILSADLLAFITPSELHPLWGRLVMPVYERFTSTTSERLVFAGFIPLFLAGWAASYYKKNRLAQFWSLFTAVFWVLALGPYLHIGGNILKIGGFSIPMPYLFLYRIIPFIGISRSLSRFDLMVMIGLGVLAALALARLKLKAQLPLLALIGFEFLAAPYPMSAVDTPAFFKTLAADPEACNIAYLPMNWDRPVPLLYQTTHGKGLLTAYTSRNNPLDLSWRTPVLQQWRTLNADILKTDLAAVAPTVLRDFNLKYVVLDYYQMPPGPEREATERWVRAALPDVPPVYRDDRLTVYRAPVITAPQPYLQLGRGWGSLDMTSPEPARLMADGATLRLRGMNGPAEIVLQAQAGRSLQSVRAYQGQVPLLTIASDGGAKVAIEVPAGATEISLTVADSAPVAAVWLHAP